VIVTITVIHFCDCVQTPMIWPSGTAPTQPEDTPMTSFSAIASLLAASAFNSNHGAGSQRQTEKVQAAQLKADQNAGK